MNPADLPSTVAHMGTLARACARQMAAAPVAARNAALRALGRRLRDGTAAVAAANRADVDAARASGLAPALIDRLKLDAAGLETVAQGCEQIAAMADPIGAITDLREQPSGIRVGRMRVPIGVFAMIYESRPNVTIEAAALAIKSGNACILRGGSEAIGSNVALCKLVQAALDEAGLPP
ncbi:MAG: gamma-glutamyl-phosphate reductase, partial [Caldimonas sp.]